MRRRRRRPRVHDSGPTMSVSHSPMSPAPVVVFLGPSMPLDEARQLLDAEYRPPVRRGDLTDLAPGTTVALIDGVFEQSLAVSPREIHDAIERGLVVFGGGSMGALRAVEVPGVIGVGRIFEWYRDRIITRDDEVSLLFDDSTGRPLTVPMVNVRFAVERLCRPGTLDPATGDKLLAAAQELPYERRRYQTILKVAGLSDRADSQDLIAMLEAHDLKHRDAQAVLEAVDRYLQGRRTDARAPSVATGSPARADAPAPAVRATTGDEVLIWESGDRVTWAELFAFLAFTGKLETYARSAIARFALEGNTVEAGALQVADHAAQAVFSTAVRRWGWVSSEEAQVTLSDLGLDVRALSEHCSEEATAREMVRALIGEDSIELRKALRAELFLNELALKRETMRLGSLRFFARAAQGPATQAELREAETVLCKVNQELELAAVRQRWERLGLADRAAQDAFIEQLALARRSGKELARAMNGRRPRSGGARAGEAQRFALGPCPKPPGEARFCLPVTVAVEHAERLREVIGVTRVGMIGELGELGGVQIAQAARPGNGWSSSYGSGKSLSKQGAIVGSIMEETEKWAQEQFRPDEDRLLSGSYAALRGRGRFVDPATLDLPYDSIYHPDMPLHWYECFDLASGEEIHLPVDVLLMRRRKHDICFTQRGARKHLATNGLGSGFSREEAVLHAMCEFVERHAQRLFELFSTNPGELGDQPYRFVDLDSASDRIRDLAERLGRNGATVRVLDITSDVAIPTFTATIMRELRRADGYGTHPDPETAIEMALLEAAQTISSVAAGGREDLSIHARSLGRHERPRPHSVRDAWFWLDPDPVYEPVSDIAGFSSGDVYEDIRWCLDRIRDAGVEHVPVLDLTLPAIEPAHVVRVLVPGLESNNPFFTGARARLVLLRDLMPKWR